MELILGQQKRNSGEKPRTHLMPLDPPKTQTLVAPSPFGKRDKAGAKHWRIGYKSV